MSVSGPIELSAAGQPVQSGLRPLRIAENRRGVLALAALALMGLGLILFLTRDGAGAGGDSAWYLMGAQNLLAGDGYSRFSGGGELRPITGFPPMFSMVLAGLGAVGIPPLEGARLLNPLLFGAAILLAGTLILRISGSAWAAVLGASLLLVSFTLIELFSWVMSEPLYIVLALLSIHLLSRGVAEANRRWIAVAGLLAAAASLTRYLGFSLLAAGGLCVLLLGQDSWKRRLANATLFLLVGGLPTLIWIGLAASGERSLAGRPLVFHPMSPALLDAYKGELVAWVFAGQLPLPWRPRAVLAGAIAAIGPAYFVWRKIRRKPPATNRYGEVAIWILGTYLAAFAVVLLVNSLLLDAATTLGAPERYLAPAYVALVVLATALTFRLASQARYPRIAKPLAAALGLFLVGLHLLESVETLGGPGVNLGYAGVRRDSPELVEALEAIATDRPIISNNPELVYILTDRPAYLLPFEFDPYSQLPRNDYEQNIRSTRVRLEDGGVLVIFGNPDDEAIQAMEDLNVTPLTGVAGNMFYGAAP